MTQIDIVHNFDKTEMQNYFIREKKTSLVVLVHKRLVSKAMVVLYTYGATSNDNSRNAC